MSESLRKQAPSPSLRPSRPSRQDVEGSRDKHAGRASASDVRSIVARQTPSMVAADAIVPEHDDVAAVLAPNAVQVKGKNGKPGAVMETGLPIAVPTAKTEANPRGLALADLDWVRNDDGRLSVSRTALRITLPADAGGVTTVGNLSLRLAPGADAGTSASVAGESTTYPNVAKDQDLVVRSTPLGVQAAWVLRSPDADRRLRVPITVPTGGKLVKQPDDSVHVEDSEGLVVASVSAPSANDAAGQPVSLGVSIDSDAIVIAVEPDVDQTQWPVVVDPTINGGYPLDRAQWDAGPNSTADAAATKWKLLRNRSDNNLSGAYYQSQSGTYQSLGGLLLFGNASSYGFGSGQYHAGDYATFNRYAPGNPSAPANHHGYWFRFDAGNISYSNSANHNDPAAAFAIYNSSYAPMTQRWRGQAPGGSYTTESYSPTVYANFPIGYGAGTTGAGATIYTSQTYDDYASAAYSPDNIAVMALSDQGTLGTGNRPNTTLHLGWYRLYAMDAVSPVITSTTNGSTSWTANPPTTIAGVSATDGGVGTQLLGLESDTGADLASAQPICPVSERELCPFATPTYSFPTGTVPEGRRNYRLTAIDAAGNVSTGKTIPFAVDRDGPTITPSGALYADRDSPVRGGLTRKLTVTATDGDPSGGPGAQRSGVASIRILVDSNEVQAKTQTATGDSQGLTTTWDPVPGAFTKGNHTVRIETTDRAGNTSAKEFVVEGGCCGTTAGNRPDDTLISDSLNQRTSYGVSVVTGNLLVSAKDVAINGLGGGLQLTRYYNSVHNGTQALYGDGFSADLTSDVRLFNVDGSDDKTIRLGDGQVYRFKKKPDAAGWDRPAEPSSLEADLDKTSTDTYTLTFPRSKAVWAFTSSGKLKSITDRNDNKVTLDYSTSGELNKITDANGRDLTVTLNADHRITKLTDVSGREWVYSYGGAGGKYLTGYTDPTNGQTSYEYDSQNRLQRIVSPGQRAARFTYTTNGPQDRIATIVRETGASGSSGPTWTFDYGTTAPSECSNPSAQQATVVTDPRGNQTRYCITKDTLRVKRAIDAKDHTRDIDFTPMGQVEKFSSGTGTSGATTTNTFNATNSLENQTQPEGEQSVLGYGTDKYRPQESTDADQKKQFYGYSAAGQLTSVRERNDTTPQASATLDYNTDGTIKTAKDALGRTTNYSYFDGTKAGMLKTYDPPGPLNDTTFEYDSLGRTTKVTDGRGKVRTLQYDGLDQNTKVTFDGGSTQTIILDSDGNVVQRDDTVGGTYSYDYDKLNRRTQDRMSGNRTITYTYDAIGNLATLTDPSGTTSYGYNEINQNCYVAPQTNNPTAACSAPPSGSIGLEYDVHGFPTARHYPNGTDVELDYDRSGKPQSIVTKRGTTVLSRRDYSYDTTIHGKLLKRLEKGTQGTVDYTYDAIGRLIGAKGALPRSNGAAGDLTYTYDHAGNRESTKCEADGQSSTVTYEYNDANQLTDASKTGTICSLPVPATSFSYDGAGNDQRFTFNDRNQTTNMAGRALAYAGAGQNELITEGPDTIENTLLGEGRRMAGGLGLGAATRYIRGVNGEIYARRSPTGIYRWYTQDALGSVIATTDTLGNVAESYNYDPDGNTSAKPTDFGFAAGYVTGTTTSWRYHYGARWYDPQTARWTQPDTLDSPADLRQSNRYAYAASDPINNVDPTGLCIIMSCDSWDAAGRVVKEGVKGGIQGAFQGALVGLATGNPYAIPIGAGEGAIQGAAGQAAEEIGGKQYGGYVKAGLQVFGLGKGLYDVGRGNFPGLFNNYH